MAVPRLSLYDLTPSELESFFLSIGEKAFRAKQVMDFLYRHPVDSFEQLTNLPISLRERLSEIVRLAPLTLRATVESPDGAVKHAYEVERLKGADILLESVWMPAESTDVGPFGEKRGNKENPKDGRRSSSRRHTLCVSSQLGCAVGCSFCATGSLGLRGQLSAGEIVYQVIDCLKLYRKLPDAVLFMGMGEPMQNFEAVGAGVEILTHPDALGLSQRRIVMSTAGELERLGAFHRRFPRVRLAISLNAATDGLRTNLMPINERFDLKTIRAFVQSLSLTRGGRITLEYVVLGDVNDTPEQVRALIGFLKPIGDRVKVNLIPFNKVEGKKFRAPDRRSVIAVQQALRKIGVSAFIRRNRGHGVAAACGQLAGRAGS